MSCDPAISEPGYNGACYAFCPSGFSPVASGPTCARNCPNGYVTASDINETQLMCLRPHFQREIKPPLLCPPGAERQYGKCLLACPPGTKSHYGLCNPECPKGFVQTQDGLSCQAEFVKRYAIVREACYANETRVDGRRCLGPCDAGTLPLPTNKELCYATIPPSARPFFWTGDPKFKSDVGPLVSKIIFSRTEAPATCDPDFEPLNGACFSACPRGTKALATQCVVDCPQGFASIANQTACARPIIKRTQILTTGQRIVSGTSTVFNAIVLIMIISILSSFLI